MKVLIACEFSGIVRDAFLARGHDAWSCDLLDTERPGPHIRANLTHVLRGAVGPADWDLMIAHPPCRYLSWAGNVWLKQPGRIAARAEAMEFFMEIARAPIRRIAIENPKGHPCRVYRAPDQIIQPYHFGHSEHKPTCLWLKNLPHLKPTMIVDVNKKWDGRRWRYWTDAFSGWDIEKRRKARSRTFQGIADAMAEQWSFPK